MGEDSSQRRSTCFQVLMALVSNSALLSSGMTLGFTAVALPYLLKKNDYLTVSSEQGSWVASLAAIATPLGCLVSGPVIDRFGRRFGLFILNFPAIIGWLCVGLKPSLFQLYVGRLLTGFACGMSSTPSTVYLAEASTASLRGLLVTGSSVAISAGVALVYTFGLIFQENWRLVALCCSGFPILSMLLIWWQMPESPVWLLAHNREADANLALMKLRGAKAQKQVQDEFTQLVAQNRTRKIANANETFFGTLNALSRPESYKPLILMNLFFLFQQLSGIFVVVFYAVDVVQEAGVKSDPFVVAVLIGCTRLIFTGFAAMMSKKLGRRPTAIISGTGMTVSLLILAVHLMRQSPLTTGNSGIDNTNATGGNYSSLENSTVYSNGDEIQNDASYVPVISILVYILTSTLGFLTLPWAMIGEVFPSRVRGMAGGITTCMTYVVSFFTVKLYPSMVRYLDKHGVFFFYGGMALLGTVFVFLFLPETQGKSLAEIERYFAGKGRSNKKITTPDEEEALNSTQMVTIVPKGQS